MPDKLKPRYFVAKRNRDGSRRFYWQPKASLVEAGWRMKRLAKASGALGDAIKEAEAFNAELDAWYKGEPAGSAARGANKKNIELVQPNSLAHVIRLYRDPERSPDWKALRPKTQREYGYLLNFLEKWAGDVPVRAIGRKSVRNLYRAIHKRAPAQANATIRVLRIVLGFALDEEMVEVNAATKPRLKSTPPRLVIWEDHEIDALLTAADELGLPSIGDAIILALCSGQREGDVLAMIEARQRGRHIFLRQSKTRQNLKIPLHPRLAQRLAESAKRREKLGKQAIHLVTYEGTRRRYSQDHFQHLFGQVRATAAEGCPNLKGKFFMDLRDSAVTRLGEAGCTLSEICAITGHEEKSVHQILKHYMALTPEMAENAIAKLVAHEEQKKADKGTK